MTGGNNKKASKRILLIEDDDWYATSLASSLRHCLSLVDIKVQADPRLVFDLIDVWLPDVIISDIHLGEKNFFTLLNELQSYGDTRAVPKIILSSSGEQLSLEDLRGYGVVAVYDKATYEMTDLAAELIQLLNQTNCLAARSNKWLGVNSGD